MSLLLLVGVLATAVCYRVYLRYRRISISDIPGPKAESFILGNLRQYFQSQAGAIDFEWQEAYGDIVRFKGPFGEDRLLVADPKALQHIYHTSGYNYSKQKERREVSRLLSGHGLIWADGQTHKRQRRIMNPAFGSKESRALVPIFVNSASKLSTKWKDMLSTADGEELVFDMANWLARATLDAMGIAAFDYHFGTLENAGDELGNAYANLCMEAFGNLTERDILKQSIVPHLPQWILQFITNNVPNRRLEQLRKTSAVASKVAQRLIDEKAEALISGKGNRDVMSLLVQANVSENEKTRMSNDEMIAQMRTLLLAGYETTATSLNWILLEIARHEKVQTRLRQEIHEKEGEIRARGDAEFTAADFDSMPYLTAVLKEGLRYHPAAYSTYREAAKDDILPLHTPITTRSGKIITEIPVPKGTKVVTSINGYNRHKAVFGPDSHVFDPDRWLTPGRVEKAASVGVYGNLLSFAAGVRACIGWRFAVLELQAFIVELVGQFEISLTPEALRVRREACLVMAPTIEGQLEKGNQLPLKVKLASRSN
ncbi:cytochrome P450 [Crepidotus variabilis]|uniref:Cytochrome P450 n=1 Tax=Crepidotus variabilis TaxID=179855 RepID=A0A9P6EHI1_9AGAR|nr:cytochrome P450 [Crepidotus variabilis]